MTRIVPLTVVLMLALTSVPAQAQSTVAVLGVDVLEGPAKQAGCMTRTLESQVKGRSGYALGASKDITEIKLVFGCINTKAQCMARAGAKLNVDKLLWGTLTRSGRNYRLAVKLLDVTRAQVDGEATAEVSARALKRTCAARAVERLAGKLLVNRFGKLVITANVQGAEVLIGNTVIGVLENEPIVLDDVPPGDYRIQLNKSGYLSAVSQIKVVAGRETRINAELFDATPTPAQPPVIATPGPTDTVDPPRSRGWKIAFWTSAVATVGFAVGTGVAGYTVIKAQEDKNQLIEDFRSDAPGRNNKLSSDDVCGETLPGRWQGELDDICSRGDTHALLTNVFVGLTVAAAAASGFFYYKAYVSDSGERSAAVQAAKRPARSARRTASSIQWIVAPSVGPQGGGVGLHMRF